MNHDELDTALRAALDRQAAAAPSADGLLDRVRHRRRRRAVRHRATLALAAAVVIGAVATGVAVRDTGSPALFGADEIALCFQVSDDRITGVLLTERLDGSDVDADSGTAETGVPHLEHRVDGGRFTVTVEVLPGPLDARAGPDTTPVSVADRPGLIGPAPAGGRLLLFDSGVTDAVVAVRTGDPAPDDAALLDWAARFVIGTDPAACGT